MFEAKTQQPISSKEFYRRLVAHSLLTLGFLAIGLGIGILGYHIVAGLSWIDSLLEASMILGGMGPTRSLGSDSAKIFASCYALFSGLAFIGVAGIMLSPIAHRILHRFHWEENNERDNVSNSTD